MENFGQQIASLFTAQNTETQAHLDKVQSKFFTVVKIPLGENINEMVIPTIPEPTFDPLLLETSDVVYNAELMTKKEIKELEKLEKQTEEAKNEVLSISRIRQDNEFLTKLKNDTNNGDITFLPPNGIFGIYKSTGGQALGVMGNDFNPMQPVEFYETILSAVQDFNADLDLNTLQFKEYCGGSKIEFSIKMHPISFKNNKGLQDITNMELTFSASYDGSKSNVITLYTERLVCTNGMVAKGVEGYIKGRNTIGGKTKVLIFVEDIAKIINSAKNFREQMEELDKKKVTKKQIEEFKLKLFGYNKESLKKEQLESDKPLTAKNNFIDAIDEAIDLEIKRTGQTLFGLLQGVTYYSNHVAQRSEQISQAEYIRFFQGAKTNDKAQELIFEMAN
jgi:hypothetical protein